MPKKKGKRENKPTYTSRKDAVRHGYIQYGKTKNGARKFKVYPVKDGYNVSRRKNEGRN